MDYQLGQVMFANMPFQLTQPWTQPTGTLELSRSANIQAQSREYSRSLTDKLENDMDAVQKQNKVTEKQNKVLKLYLILLSSYLIFPRPVAAFFSGKQLSGYYLKELGATREGILLFQSFMHGVDFPAFANGRLKLVNDFRRQWLTGLYDYGLNKLGIDDFFRIGSQMLLPQSARPTYESSK